MTATASKSIIQELKQKAQMLKTRYKNDGRATLVLLISNQGHKVTCMNTFLDVGYPITLQILAKYLEIYIYTHNFDKFLLICLHKCPAVVNFVSRSMLFL